MDEGTEGMTHLLLHHPHRGWCHPSTKGGNRWETSGVLHWSMGDLKVSHHSSFIPLQWGMNDPSPLPP